MNDVGDFASIHKSDSLEVDLEASEREQNRW